MNSEDITEGKPHDNSEGKTESTTDEDIFFLFQNDRCLATLSQPRLEDMFWCSYRVLAFDDASQTTILDQTFWETVDFEVRDAAGEIPNPHTFTGRFIEFCNGETDRLWFRSLQPPQVPERSKGIVGWLKSFF